MANTKVFLLLLLLLAGCSNIAQKNYNHSTEHTNSSVTPPTPPTPPTIASSPDNIDTIILRIKLATGIATALLTTLTYLTYSDNLPYTTWLLMVASGQALTTSAGYIYILFYNRKASDKQIQNFLQAMKMNQQVQSPENKICPICLVPGNDNQPIYSLPGCPFPSHYFHINCILGHIKNTPLRILKCPVCREQMDTNVDTKSLDKIDSAV